ncbi:hypothetical protein QUA56_16555 [Microcoleus sp. N3A4]|uniref:hypothetical protein n=1 Tax=Microcoleus sp. N3A4 TaxID=3055379 RepID=UPI002FD1F589
MGQTKAGAIKVNANKLGISVEEYNQKVESGLKNCFRCKQWLSLDLFRSDKSRYDEKNPSCTKCRNAYCRSRHKSIPKELRKPLGPPPSPCRDGDKRQARARVNHRIKAGKLPHPNSLACVDCNHFGSDKRHEYDHYKGYAGIHHLEVECVCTSCHGKREKQRHDSQQATE